MYYFHETRFLNPLFGLIVSIVTYTFTHSTTLVPVINYAISVIKDQSEGKKKRKREKEKKSPKTAHLLFSSCKNLQKQDEILEEN